MIVQRFGEKDKPVIVLLPGNMMSWRQFEHVIPLLEEDYHILAVSIDGYDDMGTVFKSAEDCAEKLEEYFRGNRIQEIALAFGESFGSATAAMLFHRQKVKIDSMIMSGPQYMNAGILTKPLSWIIPRNQYRLIGRIQSMNKLPWLLQLYTRGDDEKLKGQFRYAAKDISLETLQNCMNEALALYDEIETYEPDPVAKVSVWHGEKEPNMKKAIEKLKRAFPNAKVCSFKGFGHGEIMAHPALMADEIRRFLETEG